jgi:hypothetical protein
MPLLEEIDAQHPLQADGRMPAFALGIMRLDDGEQLGPQDDFLHAREEFLAAGGFLFWWQTRPAKNCSGGSHDPRI